MTNAQAANQSRDVWYVSSSPNKEQWNYFQGMGLILI